MRSDVATVEQYLAELPEGRREPIGQVRATVLDNLPDGYVEAMRWGMISYEVPMETSGPTYNDQPLMYAALASQKNHMAIYLTAVYGDPETAESFRERYRATGKKADIGRSCVRFKRLDDLPLDLIGDTIAATPVDEFLGLVDRIHG